MPASSCTRPSSPTRSTGGKNCRPAAHGRSRSAPSPSRPSSSCGRCWPGGARTSAPSRWTGCCGRMARSGDSS
eukprot:scaffold2048_cov224-Pinguiococcus_pyrenoidosus.AAC.1